MPNNYDKPLKVERVSFNENKDILLEVKHLKQYFNEGKRNEVRAIEDISFNIYKGETLGLLENQVVVNQRLEKQLLN